MRPRSRRPPAAPPDDPDLKREVELSLPAASPPRPMVLRGRWQPGMVPLSRVLEALHQASGLEVLADSFIPARVFRASLSGKKRVAEILEMVRKEAGADGREELTTALFGGRLVR